ncbi:NAD-dependent dehydratase [Mycolicibacterium baixiangningiae]|uniref:NAD-dependent dehydratase n=1 Tax=Mycolicibacterium baixiangningiae TaxID=2761578 RepID=UPI001866B178|nr:NAD-dependent dehydratase [Mycolicibacterium baixiangningiae]
MTQTVLPGAVDWTGDNPFVYLKTDPAGDWSSLSLFFRITSSVHGTGHLILVVTDPYEADLAKAIGLTDNEPLARFLIDDFASHFALFRPTQALKNPTLHTNAVFTQSLGDSEWVESATDDTAQTTIAMRWQNLGAPFAVHQPKHESGTTRHEMLSVFRPAQSGTVEVNGTPLPGATVERDFFGRRAQSAAMALSETWIQA